MDSMLDACAGFFIPAAYSKISNLIVFQQAGVTPLTQQLERHQFLLLGKVARSDDGGPLRHDTLVDCNVQPKSSSLTRRVGRPRQAWT